MAKRVRHHIVDISYVCVLAKDQAPSDVLLINLSKIPKKRRMRLSTAVDLVKEHSAYNEGKIPKYEEYSKRNDFDKSLINCYNLHVVISKPK
ncbi:hypothetical protein D1872_200090 [compost metagenome]